MCAIQSIIRRYLENRRTKAIYVTSSYMSMQCNHIKRLNFYVIVISFILKRSIEGVFNFVLVFLYEFNIRVISQTILIFDI